MVRRILNIKAKHCLRWDFGLFECVIFNLVTKVRQAPQSRSELGYRKKFFLIRKKFFTFSLSTFTARYFYGQSRTQIIFQYFVQKNFPRFPGSRPLRPLLPERPLRPLWPPTLHHHKCPVFNPSLEERLIATY